MAPTEADTTSGTVLNGVDVDELTATIEAIERDARLAIFRFRAHTAWQDGAHARTRIRTFTHAGEEDTSRGGDFELEGDEPQVLLGGDRAPNAVETVLHALASCLGVGFVYNAAAKGIRVDTLEFDLEGDLDLRGFLGMDGARPGYGDVRVRYCVEADATREQIEELCAYTQDTSPVLDMLRNPVDVSVTMA